MAHWYNKLTQDLSLLPDFIDYYESELAIAKQECAIGGSLERCAKDLPGITEHRFNQLQEIEAVLSYMNIELRKIRKKHFQKYLEKYNRALTSRDAEKYTDGEDEVVDYELLINSVAYLRNRFLGLIKAIETKNFMVGHITRLRTAGFEDATL